MSSFYSHGKLLITGEYVVLDGAKALAVPTKLGQNLIVQKAKKDTLHWSSYNHKKQLWYDADFVINNNIEVLSHNDQDITDRLLQILRITKQLNSDFLNDRYGFSVITTTEFPNNWGLGTSSTLINNIATWAKVDPYQLLELTFGGSGYDIACAQTENSLTYQLNKHVNNSVKRDINSVNFNPSFANHLYFVHLNQKQNSRDGIAQYRAHSSDISVSISAINRITNEMIDCDTLIGFQNLMNEHEQLISNIIKQSPVKKRLFNDFKGSIKSLGAWGGDFVMVASELDPTAYFKSKGYSTILSYTEMVNN